jgi:hypothetical protein
VTSVIVGATQMSQLDDNLKAVDLKLLDGEIDNLEAVAPFKLQYPYWFTELTADATHKEFLGAK